MRQLQECMGIADWGSKLMQPKYMLCMFSPWLEFGMVIIHFMLLTLHQDISFGELSLALIRSPQGREPVWRGRIEVTLITRALSCQYSPSACHWRMLHILPIPNALWVAQSFSPSLQDYYWFPLVQFCGLLFSSTVKLQNWTACMLGSKISMH